MDFQIMWTEPAAQQYQEAIEYLADRNSPAAARLGDEILKKVELMPPISRRERIEAMLTASPDDAELHYMLAMEHVSSGDDAGAVAVFAKLVEVAPDYAPGYHQAARALQRLDRIAEARSILEKGIPIAQRQGNEHAAGEMQGLIESLE